MDDPKGKKELTVIFPVYNEQETIARVVREWKITLDSLDISYQIMICEDGSTDGTRETLMQIKDTYHLVFNQKKLRRGYGRSIIDGVLSAQSDYILCVDSDGQYKPADFKKLWSVRGKARIIRGVRTVRCDDLIRKICSRLFYLFFIFFFPSVIKDPSSSFVLFPKKAVTSFIPYLSYMQEGFWWGFSAISIARKTSFFDIPISHQKRLSGKTRVYEMKKMFSIAFRNLRGLLRLKRQL